MKAFILAAGIGERLRPLTDNIPKCLVPIQGVPLLAIWLELCRRHGISEILVNAHSHAEKVREFLLEHSEGIQTRIAKEETLLGSAGTLWAHRHWTEPDEEFWVFYADVLTNMNLTRMLASHRAGGQIATMGVHRVADPTQCGIVTVDQNRVVTAFAEKPAYPQSDLAFSGILVAVPAIFKEIPRQIPSDLGFHVLPKLVGRMAAYVIPEYLVDVGTPGAYRAAQFSWPGLGALSRQEARSC